MRGIVGSPCKNGSVDLLVSEVLKGAASKGAETCKLYLNDLNIKPCQSCGVDPNPEHCLFKDDMEQVYDVLENCDAVVLGSPVYFDTVSAQVKLMIDRSNCLMPYVEKADGTFGFERRLKKPKKGVFVVVSGKEQELDTILATVKGFFFWANIELVETVSYAHDDNELGSAKSDEVKMKQAFDVGVRLLERDGE
ncbi:MAG TPA: flavodoxin family protein [Candidatus Bathyarchaeia archaeon]|nr:flavodoxin family protein [Candidatus Bathyarchaeia archaeon]